MLKELFTPFEINGVKLKNRIVMPGLASFLIEDDGSITEKTVEHYLRRAAGGPAMVIVEACAVSSEGIVSSHQARIYDDRFLEGLSKIAGVMRSEGAVPAVQIHHGGRQTSARTIKRKPVAPSNLPCPTIKGDVEPLTINGIQEIIAKFGDAADRAADVPCQEIFQRNPPHPVFEQLIRQLRRRLRHPHPDLRRRGERIALYVIDVQGEPTKVVRAAQLFVRSVSSPVDPSEDPLQVLRVGHASLLTTPIAGQTPGLAQ